MFFNIIPNRLSVYRSSEKDFMVVTKIVEQKDKIMIKRNITYYNHKSNKYVKRTELQHYDCKDYDINNSEEDPYCKELKQYAKLFEDSKTIKQEPKIKVVKFKDSDWLNYN